MCTMASVILVAKSAGKAVCQVWNLHVSDFILILCWLDWLFRWIVLLYANVLVRIDHSLRRSELSHFLCFSLSKYDVSLLCSAL